MGGICPHFFAPPLKSKLHKEIIVFAPKLVHFAWKGTLIGPSAGWQARIWSVVEISHEFGEDGWNKDRLVAYSYCIDQLTVCTNRMHIDKVISMLTPWHFLISIPCLRVFKGEGEGEGCDHAEVLVLRICC